MDVFSSMNEFVSKNKHVNFITELNRTIEKMGLTMVYEGRIDQGIIKIIASSVEKKMNEEKETLRLQKLIFHIIIEFLQNISKYSDDEKKGKGIIIVGKTTENYYISSGNIIRDEKVKSLSASIDYVNKLNPTELKGQYETQISNRQFNQQGGAGLGLIDIVRKSRQKLEYNFESLNNGKSFFLITATVLKEK